MKDNGYNTKVPVPAGPSTLGRGKEQPKMGKLGDGMESMLGGASASKGGAVKTIPSQSISGKNGNGTTSMGSGGVIPGKI